MTTKNLEEIEELVKKLKVFKEVKAVYLFGSVAKGKATPLSDIDICVITDKASEEIKAEISCLSSEKIEICLFEDLPMNLRVRIFKEGKVLFMRDEGFISSVRADLISEYLDFKPILKRYYEKALGLAYE